MLTSEEIIKALKPCHYKYNDIKDLGEKIQYGFIAQDILDAFGDEYSFVQEDKQKEFYQVNYTQFIAPLVGVVQSQQEEIEQLKEELKKIKEMLC